MLELSRTVRFCLNDPPSAAEAPPKDNTFAAWPPMRGLGRYYELVVLCRGEADPKTGYFINIKHIDQAVHRHAVPCIQSVLTQPGGADDVPIGRLLRDMLNSLQPALRNAVDSVCLRLTPTYHIELRNRDMDHVLIRQRYEFSAAHRLHVPELTDEENRETFGKCNNPAGHGHNYQVEVAVRLPIAPDGQTAPVQTIDTIVNRHAIELLDHKHLNTDVPQFADLNPSVENIAKVIWQMLEGRFTELGPDAGLDELSVWETSKTVCTYRGPAVPA